MNDPTLGKQKRTELRDTMNRIASRQIVIPRRIDWETLNNLGVANRIRAVLEKHATGEDGHEYFICNAWERIFEINEPLYRELILEFVASFVFDATKATVDCHEPCMTFRLGGIWRSLSLADFGVALGIYTQAEVNDLGFDEYMVATEKKPESFNPSASWAIIGDGDYTSNIKVKGLLSSDDRLFHRMLVHAVNSRSSSEEKITVYDLWLLDRLTTDDRYPNAPYIIAVQLTKASGYREGSKMLGGQYITRLARHFGVLTPEAMVSMTNLGNMGLIDIEQLRGMEVVKPVRTRDGLRYAWVTNPTTYEPREVPERTHEHGGSSSGAEHVGQPPEWNAYTAYQGLTQQFSDFSMSQVRHQQRMEYNAMETLHQTNWQSGVLNQMAGHFGLNPEPAYAPSPLWPYTEQNPPGYPSFEDWQNHPRGPY